MHTGTTNTFQRYAECERDKIAKEIENLTKSSLRDIDRALPTFPNTPRSTLSTHLLI